MQKQSFFSTAFPNWSLGTRSSERFSEVCRFIGTPKNLLPIDIQVQNLFHGLVCAEAEPLKTKTQEVSQHRYTGRSQIKMQGENIFILNNQITKKQAVFVIGEVEWYRLFACPPTGGAAEAQQKLESITKGWALFASRRIANGKWLGGCYGLFLKKGLEQGNSGPSKRRILWLLSSKESNIYFLII